MAKVDAPRAKTVVTTRRLRTIRRRLGSIRKTGTCFYARAIRTGRKGTKPKPIWPRPRNWDTEPADGGRCHLTTDFSAMLRSGRDGCRVELHGWSLGDYRGVLPETLTDFRPLRSVRGGRRDYWKSSTAFSSVTHTPQARGVSTASHATSTSAAELE